MGHGQRAVLYTAFPKKAGEATATKKKPTFSELRQLESKADFRETQAESLKDWNHFDSNINN